MRKIYKFQFVFLIGLFVLFSSNFRLRAQVNTYSFSSNSGTYTPITGGILLGTETNDDQRFVDPAVPAGGFATTGVGLPIGFDFTFNGQVYNRLAINANGWISLGSSLLSPAVNNASTSAYTPLASTTVATPTHLRNRIAAVGRDLQAQTGATLRLETIGTAPNRVCVVQWSNYRKWNSTGDNYNFQIRLYETTNIVEVVYGTFINNTTNLTAHVGLGGSVATDFNNRTTTTNWSATTPGATNTATCTATSAIVPASGTIFRWVGPPPTPPTPFQVFATTSCINGTDLDVTGTPPADVTWYWQSTALGTSTANPYSGPYNVLSNGTFFLRALNTTTSTWSTTSSSVTVSDFPTATAPPAPVADVNPSCVPIGSQVTMDNAPVGTTYYWQTVTNGTSTANPVSGPLAISSTSTVYVSAFETASGCWSPTSSLVVTVDTYIPSAPTTSINNFNICSGAITQEVSVDPYPGIGSVNLSFGTNLQSPGPATSFPLTVPALPSGATITSAQLLLSNVNAINGSWRSEIRVATSGIYTLAQTQISTLASSGLISPDPVINLAGFPTTGGVLNLVLSETFDDGGAGTIDATFGNVQLVINYSIPVTTSAWYDSPTGGNVIGTGSPFETVGSAVLSNPATFGTYSFYAGGISGGCQSTDRTLITVNVTDVNAILTPIDASCNGGNNGSFALGTVQCGTEPFLYSVNGGAFGPIPTDLTAGTYSVVIEDDNGLLSAPISVVVGQPAPPTALNASGITYFTADISWTTTGDETSWTVEYGPAGFTPGTGTTLVVSTGTDTTLTGLTENTSYDFYVTPNCGAGSQAGGPGNFNTNTGFFTWDTDCGPGFIDISSTGTAVDLTDDFLGAETFGVTMPFAFTYQGTSVSNVTINHNGTLVLGTLTGNSGFTNTVIGAATPNGLYPFWDDLDGGTAYYETVGTAPNRMFIVQWESFPLFPGVDSQNITFQVIIEEATNEIYFIYDDVVFGGSQAAADFGGGATIGAAGPNTDVQVSFNSPTFLQNNSCVHFYEALCPNPVLVSNTIFQEEVILDWNAGLYGETEWTIIYGPAGFDPATEGTTLSGLTNSDANIFGLTQLTDYDVYIYAECQLDDLTSPGLLVSFQTLPWCANPTALGGTLAVDSLFATWNWTPASGATNGGISGFNIQYGSFGFDLYSGTVEVATGVDLADTVTNPNFLAGGVYQYYVQAVCGVDTSNYSGPFTFVMPLTNDAVCGAEMLSVDGTVYYFNNTGATVQAGEAAIVPSGSNPDGYNTTELPMMTWGVPIAEGTTWFTFEAPASGSIRFSGLDQNQFASQIAIYETTDCGAFEQFELVAASDQVNADVTSKVAPNFTICGLTPGATYYIMHDAWSNGFGGAPIFGQYSIKLTPIVLDAGNFTEILNVCSGSEVELFEGIADYDNGGVWSAELPSAGTQLTGSTWSSAGFAYQVFNFEYRLTDGCAFDTTFAKVRVWAPSNAGTDGSINVCRNQPLDLLSGLNGTVDLGGTWYNISLQPMASSAITSSNIPGQFNYYYVAGNGVCPDDTALVLVNVSSSCNYLDVEELYFSTMTIMPNPSNGVFNINNTGSTEVFNYIVTDVDGRVILTKDAAINGTETTVVDLTDKVTGMYMIRVYNDNAEKVFRVIKQ